MTQNLALVAEALNASARDADIAARINAARARIEGRMVFTTSFGLEDQMVTHAIARSGADVEIVTLDTGRMFPETYDVWAATEKRYGLRIAAFHPRAEAVEALVARQGINGFYDGLEARKSCCAVRKVEPLGRALAGAGAWVTGLRAGQSAARQATRATTARVPCRPSTPRRLRLRTPRRWFQRQPPRASGCTGAPRT